MRFGAYFLTIWLLAGASACATAPSSEAPETGQKMPPLRLPVPERTADQHYLGISGQSTFELTRIEGDLLIVQIFSMYCPHCQKAAPHVNRLFEIIESRKQLRGRIKLIGIGAGNSPFEVKLFAKTYKIPFPLFADKDFQIHHLIGQVRTPYFFGIRIGGSDKGRIFYSKLGGFEDAEAFLNRILATSGWTP